MITVAVIGAGHWGPNLIRNFDNHQTSTVSWVVDRDESRLEKVRARYRDVRTTADAAEPFGDPEVDAVVIATPTTTHFELAHQALEAGKHVMVEKPIAATVEEGERLCELAERNGLTLMVGHVFVHNAGVQQVRRYLEEQTLGRIFYISMVRTNLGPIRMDVNAAWDLAPHDISIANYWLGGQPDTVTAVGGSWINPGLEDAVFAVMRYPGDVLVHLHASWLNPRKDRLITVVGDQQMLTFDDMNLAEPIRIWDKGVSDELTEAGFADTFGSFRASVREGDILIPRIAMGEPLLSECDHFIECVANRREPYTPGRAGVAVVRVLEAITRSIKNGGREEQVL